MAARVHPDIVKQAKRDKAEIYFWDESGFRADAVQGRTWGRQDQTPVVSVPGQRQGVSAASAVNSKGGFWFALYNTGGLNGERFVGPLLLDQFKTATGRSIWYWTVCRHTRAGACGIMSTHPKAS